MPLRSSRPSRFCAMGNFVDSALTRDFLLHLAPKKIADGAGNFLQVRFQCEVTGVVEMQLRSRYVAPEGLGARRDERLIVLAPDEENGWAAAPEIFLDL